MNKTKLKAAILSIILVVLLLFLLNLISDLNFAGLVFTFSWIGVPIALSVFIVALLVILLWFIFYKVFIRLLETVSHS